MDLDDAPGDRLVADADGEVLDLELVGRRALGDLDLRFLIHGHAGALYVCIDSSAVVGSPARLSSSASTPFAAPSLSTSTPSQSKITPRRIGGRDQLGHSSRPASPPTTCSCARSPSLFWRCSRRSSPPPRLP